jgi:hypothetical protein
LAAGKRVIENLVQSGALRIRFEALPEGLALRYAAADLKRIAAEPQIRQQLRTDAARLRSDRRRWEAERQLRLARERVERAARQERLEAERTEAERIEAERQRIYAAALAAKGSLAG